jgi:NAD(P)-dependent dehydrogenase (short-subunit alcohol dehydrogenase family)
MAQPTVPLPDALSLHGKTVLVTGAASGIGRATCSAAAQLGARLVIADVTALERTADELRAAGATIASSHQGDLGDADFVHALLAAHGRYDAMVHAAGIFPRTDTPEQETFERVMQVNLRAGMMLSYRCAMRMAETGGGKIVLIGSLAARNGGMMTDNMSLNYAAYAVSKGGLHTMVTWLSRRMAEKNVLVNAIAPGVVRSPMAQGQTYLPGIFPMGRPAEVDEVAWPAVFLCTAAASYFSGAIIDVNGGSYVSG